MCVYHSLCILAVTSTLKPGTTLDCISLDKHVCSRSNDRAQCELVDWLVEVVIDRPTERLLIRGSLCGRRIEYIIICFLLLGEIASIIKLTVHF